MADRNKNGIPDELERKGSRGRQGGGTFGKPGDRKKPGVSERGWLADKGSVYEPSTRYGGIFGEIANFSNDVTRNIANFIGDPLSQGRPGGGFGDSLVGSSPAAPFNRPARRSNRPGAGERLNRAYNGGEAPVEEAGMTLADYIRMASEMIGGGPGVNYDPQRNAARSQAAENDARLAAMYRQLRGSIDADAPIIKEGFQEAIGSTKKNSTQAQEQAQAATDAANARNNEVLANLGIQEAQGNIIQNGTDLNSQTANNIAAMAAKGQAAGDRLVSNQQSALTHNTNVGNAAGLEGNLQRAANQARLQALLAEIDMQEQQENAAYQQQGFSQQMGLANELLNFDRYNQEREDNLQMSAAELAAEAQNQRQLPDLGAFLQAMGISIEELAQDPRKYAPLLTAGTKYSYAP